MDIIIKNKEMIKKIIAAGLGLAVIICAIVFFVSDCFVAGMTRNFYMYFVLILMSMLVPTGYLLYLIMLGKEFNYAKLFVLLGLCWGLNLQFVMPPCSGPDEEEHIINAFHASNTYLGLKDQEFDVNWEVGKSYFYMRAEDMKAMEENEFSFPNAYYIISNGNIVHCSDSTLVKNYDYPARFYRYIFSGFGIAVGRLLNLGFVGTLMLGRLMNTLVYVLMGYLILKILPLGRLQMFGFLLLPTVLELCNCYSYDNFSILFSMLLLALCFYYSKPEIKLRLVDMFILVLCLAMLAPNKYVYVTFAIWIFMIPLSKWQDWIKRDRKTPEKIGIAGLLVTIAVVGFYVFYKIVFHMIDHFLFEKEEGASIEQMAGRESYSMSYIIHHPFKTIGFALDGIRHDFWYNLKCVVGSELGDLHLNAPIPLILTLAIMAVLIVGIVLGYRYGNHASKKQVILVAVGMFLCLTAIFIGCLVRFTPVEGAERVQISYRYLVPFYMAFTVIFGTDEKENSRALLVIYGQNLLLALTSISLLDYLLG